MKNLFLAILSGLILLTACSKDESFEPIDEQSNEVVYVFDQNMDVADFSNVTIDKIQEISNNRGPGYNEGFAHSSGFYKPQCKDPMILSWFANLDDTGCHGTAELQIIRPNFTMHLAMETECINAEGNKAVYGAIITEVIEISGNIPPITEMWRLYFEVTDNYQMGSGGFDHDQISNRLILASPRSVSLCNVYPPNHPMWSSEGHSDVMSPGFVKVTDLTE
ncbi:MAG: hypothetical protein KJO39_11635 [Bacteroidia bacterium]|nr:hypothetical protein [Bacteroidia bacterium]NNF31733.1 hypothetical protein [Flavobacteriaceae bacterium]NNJ81106.1 hypothetical protein [Flavobacteriaceae bacterium]NNK55247.1 hypothetical protein [Flavobacteriaceae bacterium]NNM10242.1 hypothetical protein [Flavobacteriaceae bacterium]